MESLIIEKNDQISINQLIELSTQGYSVLRSAHVGNFSPYNLTLTAAGIPMLLVDHNITDIDTNYFPGATIKDGQISRIARPGIVVCRALVEGSNTFLDEFHISQVEKALPNANVVTNSTHVRRNESIAAEIISIAATNFPELFTRIVGADGTAARDARAISFLEKYGILQLNDDLRAESPAVMLPNVVDILLGFTIEALQSDLSTQYHLSGPDMIRYINKILPDLNNLYSVVLSKASFRHKLPRQMNVQLVPSSEARFATTEKRRSALEGLIQAINSADQVEASLAQERRDFFSGSRATKNEQDNFLHGIRLRKKEAKDAIELALKSVPEIFCGPGKPNFITQFDVIDEGGLFVPDMNLNTSMGLLKGVFNELSKMAGQKGSKPS